MNNTSRNKTAKIEKIILGIDIGTSGVRATIVAKRQQTDSISSILETTLISRSVNLDTPLREPSTGASTQEPLLWIAAINKLFKTLQSEYDLSQVTHLIVDATSSTVLLCDSQGSALTTALMYNDHQAVAQAQIISKTPQFDTNSGSCGAIGASSTLAKVLFLLDQLNKNPPKNFKPIICHQIDFINYYLCKSLNTTDENNALKLGYDSVNQQWPSWVVKLLKSSVHNTSELTLPTVVKPGSKLAKIDLSLVEAYGFSANVSVHAGTTDSIAGFLASGATNIGDAVSSLGSTIAVKLITDRPVFNSKYGIYSHRLNNHWLVGGASNAGGAILLEHYTLDEIKVLIQTIDENNTLVKFSQPAVNQYYPLTNPGERFPIADSNLQPKMPPKPAGPLFNPASGEITESHQRYFIRLVQGLTDIEQLAYKRLNKMGSVALKRLYSVGGGVKNALWMQLRASTLSSNIEIKEAYSLDAAYGVTKLIE